MKNLNELTWKLVKGWEDLYEIAEDGTVRSLDRITKDKNGIFMPFKGKILSHRITKSGYATVQLCRDGKPQNFYVHKLVAEAFLLNPKNLVAVNHFDGNKLNNHFSNLEWCTYSEDRQHAWDYSLNKGSTKYKVTCVELNIEAEGTNELARILKRKGFPVSQSCIQHCLAGKYPSHLGFTFTRQLL